VAQIAQHEAADLLQKLFSERIAVEAVFFSQSGTRISLPGFVDSATRQNGLVISVSGPPLDPARGYLNYFPFDRDCQFWYGEKRELPEAFKDIAARRGESVLLFLLPDSVERLGLFFTF
jgi:hypothetical protein